MIRIVILFFLQVSAVYAADGYYIEQTEIVKDESGKTTKETQQRIYVTSDRYRLEQLPLSGSPKATSTMIYDGKYMYACNPVFAAISKKKPTAEKLKTNKDTCIVMPPEKAGQLISSMTSTSSMKVENTPVTDLGKTKTIQGQACKLVSYGMNVSVGMQDMLTQTKETNTVCYATSLPNPFKNIKLEPAKDAATQKAMEQSTALVKLGVVLEHQKTSVVSMSGKMVRMIPGMSGPKKSTTVIATKSIKRMNIAESMFIPPTN